MEEKHRQATIIGVIGRPTMDLEQDSLVGIYEGDRRAIIKKGCIPLMISPFAEIDYMNTKSIDIPPVSQSEKESLKKMVDLCDGIIIPGGYRWYEYDKFIVKYAIEADIPVLGICMGMQLLATIDNCSACLEINDTSINHCQAKTKYVHKTRIKENTLLSDIVGEKEMLVNSKHKYHVTKVNKFKVNAISEDGMIEGIELEGKRFVLGLQWHPEKMLEYDHVSNKIYDMFIAKCNEYK